MKKTIGIDLGTTNSVIAFKDTSVRILRNKENQELTRSCIGFRSGELLTGLSGYQLLERDPQNTILSVKRLMGGAIKDDMVQKMKHDDYYRYTITELQGGTENAVAIVLGGRQYTPEQLSAEILKKLKADAEEKLGEEVTHAVITVPAYFSEKQKNATKIAAQLAGLKVQKLLAEPTAAAIAYGVDNLKAGDATTVLIYDFGGGTFDLSILNIADGNYLEAGTGGDRWLGGDDIDKKLQEIILAKVAQEYKIADLKKIVSALAVKKKDKFEGQLRFKTEDAKIVLSGARTANIFIDNILEDEDGEVIDIDVTITRDEFEQAIRPMIQRSIDLVEELLKNVSYDIDMIDSILLVGGSACIPLVRTMLIEKYGATKIKMTEKPMLTVAEGAAILSHRLDDGYEAPENMEGAIADISYTANHNYYIEYLEGEEMHYERVLEKQTPLPITTSSIFKTTTANQKIVRVSVFADVEDKKKQLEALGFYLIEENLPIGSELTFDFTLDIDETYKLQVYPRGKKTMARPILLARGNADEKAMMALDEAIERATHEYTSIEGEEQLISYISNCIAEVNKMGTVSDEKWHEIYYRTTEKFEEIKNTETGWSEHERWTYRAVRLLNEFGDLIDPTDRDAMREIAARIKASMEPNEQIALAERLKELVQEYSILDMTLQIPGFAERIKSYPGVGIGNTNKGADVLKLMDNFNQISGMIRSKQSSDSVGELLDESFGIIGRYRDIL